MMRRNYLVVALSAIGAALAFWLARPYFLRLSDHILNESLLLSIHRLVLISISVFALDHLLSLGYILHNRLRDKDNFLIGIRHLVFVVYAVLFVLIFLTAFNISVQEAFTSVSIVAAALAITLKDYVSNMINGMIITFQSLISFGDVVRIGEHRGKVVDITLMHIHLLNEDDDLIYIPNNVVFQQELVNYTKREIKKSSIDFEVTYDRMTNLEDLESYLIQQMEQYRDDVRANSYNLRVTEMAKDNLRMKFQYTLKKFPNKDVEKEIRKFVIRSIVRYANRLNTNTPQQPKN